MIQPYNKLFKDEYFKYIRKNIPIIPIWDDHDYGKNDGGKDWIYKDIAKKKKIIIYKNKTIKTKNETIKEKDDEIKKLKKKKKKKKNKNFMFVKLQKIINKP